MQATVSSVIACEKMNAGITWSSLDITANTRMLTGCLIFISLGGQILRLQFTIWPCRDVFRLKKTKGASIEGDIWDCSTAPKAVLSLILVGLVYKYPILIFFKNYRIYSWNIYLKVHSNTLKSLAMDLLNLERSFSEWYKSHQHIQAYHSHLNDPNVLWEL